MSLVNTLILFFVGFYILIKGAQILVRGATSVASIFNISKWFIGVVIVGIGTSVPELSINIASVFNGQTIGLGTIIGSNTFNILVILGLAAIFFPLKMKRAWVYVDFPLNILTVFLASIFILLPVFGNPAFLGITHEEGWILLALFLLWVFFMFMRRASMDDGADYRVFTLLTSFVMIIAGIIGVFLGGRWVVAGAEAIALLWGVSPMFIGLTIVAVGTSLPELTVSVVALFKRAPGIAVGNVIGSNIFDFLGILGITATLRAIPVIDELKFTIFATFAATVVLLGAMFVGTRNSLSRLEGFVFFVLYALYITLLIMLH